MMPAFGSHDEKIMPEEALQSRAHEILEIPKPLLISVNFEGACQGHRVRYFGFAMIGKKLLPEIESK